MILKRLFIIFVLVLSALSGLFAEEGPVMESDQQISEFSLSGYGEKGKKNWDLAGKTADIFTEVIKLKEVLGNLYGKEEDVKITADIGDFNKTDGKVHLEKNVVITTSSGTKLTTNSLDWDRQKQFLNTEEVVNIEKENLVIVATGATSTPNLKNVALKKNVRLDINPTDNPKEGSMSVEEKMVITCDGPLEIDYAKNIAVFNNNVKVLHPDYTIYSDRMDVIFNMADKKKEEEAGEKKQAAAAQPSLFMGSKIDKIIARGNVKVVRGDNVSYSDEAIYSALNSRLVLTGKPRLILYSTEGLGASFGN